MKAVVCTGYGAPEVLQLRDVDKPAPRPNEVLIKVRATTVSAGDVKIRSFDVPWWQWPFARLYLGLWRPKNAILGMELAGEVEAIGADVTRFEVGDRVVGASLWSGCGYAEYNCMPEDTLLGVIPPKVSFEQAAPIVGGGLTALVVLEQANIRPDQNVLVYGASGSVGTYAVQIAKSLGATVTGVCSRGNLEMVTSLGADVVVDYTGDDFTHGDETYDVVFDAVDKLDPRRGKRALKEGGIYLNVAKSSGGMGTGREHGERLAILTGMLQSGALRTVVDRRYALHELVEAHGYVEKGHKKGNVIISLE